MNGDGDPTVAILTPVKNGARYLPRYFALLERLQFDKGKLSLGFLESDSSDGTFDLLRAWAAGPGTSYRDVTLLRHDYGFPPLVQRWHPAVQRKRREIIARSRNRLLSGALGDAQWVLWLDVDLVDYPPALLRELLSVGKDIVVPHCVLPDGRTFDLNSFRIDPERGRMEDRRHLRDGIFQPPVGEGRTYLGAMKQESLAELDAVGGTALLVRADLHREGLIFPPFSYRGYIETEGLAMMARDMGSRSFGIPSLAIVHADG